MKITLILDDVKWSWAVQACAADQSDPQDKALQVVNEYLDSCGRQLGLDDGTKIESALKDPVKFDAIKAIAEG